MTARQELDNALTSYTADARNLFTAGHNAITQPTIPNNISDEEKQKRAQGMMGAGFSQLGNAARMETEQAGRVGYAAVVKLMESTAGAAAAICKRIESIVGTAAPFPAISAADYTVINTLTETLRALAQLSPAAVWTDQSKSE
jgi:hypothetical protein